MITSFTLGEGVILTDCRKTRRNDSVGSDQTAEPGVVAKSVQRERIIRKSIKGRSVLPKLFRSLSSTVFSSRNFSLRSAAELLSS